MITAADGYLHLQCFTVGCNCFQVVQMSVRRSHQASIPSNGPWDVPFWSSKFCLALVSCPGTDKWPYFLAFTSWGAKRKKNRLGDPIHRMNCRAFLCKFPCPRRDECRCEFAFSLSVPGSNFHIFGSVPPQPQYSFVLRPSSHRTPKQIFMPFCLQIL